MQPTPAPKTPFTKRADIPLSSSTSAFASTRITVDAAVNREYFGADVIAAKNDSIWIVSVTSWIEK